MPTGPITGIVTRGSPDERLGSSPASPFIRAPVQSAPETGADAPRPVQAADETSEPTANDRSRQRSSQLQTGQSQMTAAEQRQLAELRARDRAVRAHEQAHLAAAGNLATGGANYTYQKGPDDRQYAVGGEVNLRTGEVNGDPEATIRNAQRVRRAALAPVNPSATDRAVAARASTTELQARAELAEQQRAERAEESTTPSANPAEQSSDEEESEAQVQLSIDTFA